MIPVDGHKNLYRDENNGAIISLDKKGYLDYLTMKTKLIDEKLRLDKIENEVKEIKTLLLMIIENK